MIDRGIGLNARHITLPKQILRLFGHPGHVSSSNINIYQLFYINKYVIACPGTFQSLSANMFYKEMIDSIKIDLSCLGKSDFVFDIFFAGPNRLLTQCCLISDHDLYLYSPERQAITPSPGYI